MFQSSILGQHPVLIIGPCTERDQLFANTGGLRLALAQNVKKCVKIMMGASTGHTMYLTAIVLCSPVCQV